MGKVLDIDCLEYPYELRRWELHKYYFLAMCGNHIGHMSILYHVFYTRTITALKAPVRFQIRAVRSG